MMFSIGFWEDRHYASSAKIRNKTLVEKLLPRSIRFVFLCTFGAQSGNHEKRRSDLKFQQMFVQIESMRFVDLLRYKENRKTLNGLHFSSRFMLTLECCSITKKKWAWKEKYVEEGKKTQPGNIWRSLLSTFKKTNN